MTMSVVKKKKMLYLTNLVMIKTGFKEQNTILVNMNMEKSLVTN